MTNTVPGAGRRAPSCVTGLRERKKQRTRGALARAAMELFTTQGYEATTVDAIADRVDVSQRTFFRYFAGKEDAAFVVDEIVEEHYVAAVRDRPAHEAPMEALRGAIRETWQELFAAVHELVPAELHMRMYQVVESTPALLAVRLRRQAQLEQRITEVVARREGLDPRTDLRPQVLVAAFSGVVRTASQAWGQHADVSPETMRRSLERHLAVFGPELLGGWRAS
ncbi:TetR family transcriptional regulator [Streptomyces sp. SL13]|jgi:AcrR family transcriptional regulator|uniref:TetR family transcriptional regulator n=1 Tax=Streptantibioticus silvisoli TaxID=2705255 RepID=A0AA90KER8_9ACTN|nr:TetR family transcriptional regulator [Streptantibioticus silvisoli]MDI5961513.1 TetR family transcriptional regulator [Streptantibioticus silvisoli]MDI5968099.1 TetR family transcriptional regulator [Streptantibioticus silvisoli]